jgi:hypothetical protein
MVRLAVVLLFVVACEKPPGVEPPQPGKLTGAPDETLPPRAPGPTIESFYVEVRDGSLFIQNAEGLRTASKADSLCADLASSRQQLRHPAPGNLPIGVAFSVDPSKDHTTLVAAIEALKACGISRFAINVAPADRPSN